MLQGCQACGRGQDICGPVSDCHFIDGVNCYELGGRDQTCEMCKEKLMAKLAALDLQKPKELEIET